LNLYGGVGYANDRGLIVLRQVKTAGAEAAANVKDIGARLCVRALRQMLDELHLRLFL
jgi:hypothetical protein